MHGGNGQKTATATAESVASRDRAFAPPPKLRVSPWTQFPIARREGAGGGFFMLARAAANHAWSQSAGEMLAHSLLSPSILSVQQSRCILS